MPLTTSQLQALKADIIAAADAECMALEADPANSDKALAVANLYNQPASPTYWVWNPVAEVEAIFSEVTFKNFTPTDAVPGTDTGNVFLNRCLVCQSKQINLQTMLIGRQTLNASKASIRNGLKDSMQDVPAGVAGALLDAGWTNVRDNALHRKASRAEKLFATGGAGTHADASTLVFDGSLSLQDVQNAMNTV